MMIYFWEIQVFMTRSIQGTDHVWLVMMKAMRALTRYAAAGIEETGLGLSDFGVLEVLLHKGPLPVNELSRLMELSSPFPRGVGYIGASGTRSKEEKQQPCPTAYRPC